MPSLSTADHRASPPRLEFPRSYNAAHTGAPMFSVYMVVHVPTRVHIAALREEFLDLCDHLNLDAILEPLKA